MHNLFLAFLHVASCALHPIQSITMVAYLIQGGVGYISEPNFCFPFSESNRYGMVEQELNSNRTRP